MRKLRVSLIDNSVEENATLNIKDNSFVITTDSGELIKIAYSSIKKYAYDTNKSELTFFLLNQEKVIIRCQLDTQLKQQLNQLVSSNKDNTVISKTKENGISITNNPNNKYNITIFLPNGKAECDLSIRDDRIAIEQSSEILFIPYTSIIKLELTDNDDIKIYSNFNNNFIIRCNNNRELYDKLKKMKDKVKYESNAKIVVQDMFGKDILKEQNTKKITKYAIITSIVVVLVILFGNRVNTDDPASTVASDIRKGNATLGYGTKYVIGEVISASCSEEENDGNGRYIIKCSVRYYPKRNNGSIATDSMMNETIYAIYLRNSKDNYSRLYTSNASETFKTKTCWGEDKSKGIVCRSK